MCPTDVAKIVLADQFTALGESWGAHAIAQLNDYEVRVAKINGEFHWHQHDASDELYIVLSGRVRMQLADQDDIVLTDGELVVIPKGRQHCPIAEEESQLLLVWPAGMSYR